MKQLFTTFILMAFGAMTLSAQAVIKFDKTAHNFGTFPEKKVQSVVFYFTNDGDKPLVIQQVMTTCGCTTPDYTKTPIEPGKRGQIKVTYNGKGKPKGHFQKLISVRTNAKNQWTRIYIEGDMTIEE